MMDEITSRPMVEPYRIFTSRSPFRLNLRMSNAEERLNRIGYEYGLVSAEHHQFVQTRQQRIDDFIRQIEMTKVTYESWQSNVPHTSVEAFTGSLTLARLLKRPNVTLSDIAAHLPALSTLDALARLEVEARMKYSGYLALQDREIQLQQQLTDMPLPTDFFDQLPSGLSTEARQKILAVKPATLGSLAKIPGVRAGDVSVVLLQLRKLHPSLKVGSL